jgi:hypothetical protein
MKIMSKRTRIIAAVSILAVPATQGAWAAIDESSTTTTGNSVAISTDTPEKVQEVTVTAHCYELEKRVTAFVGKITGPLFDGGLVRWGKPVCLLVSGLPR